MMKEVYTSHLPKERGLALAPGPNADAHASFAKWCRDSGVASHLTIQVCEERRRVCTRAKREREGGVRRERERERVTGDIAGLRGEEQLLAWFLRGEQVGEAGRGGKYPRGQLNAGG